jgi:hypothetical protein
MEAAEVLFVGRQSGAEDFDGDLPAERRLLRQIDVRHAPSTEAANQFIVAQILATQVLSRNEFSRIARRIRHEVVYRLSDLGRSGKFWLGITVRVSVGKGAREGGRLQSLSASPPSHHSIKGAGSRKSARYRADTSLSGYRPFALLLSRLPDTIQEVDGTAMFVLPMLFFGGADKKSARDPIFAA